MISPATLGAPPPYFAWRPQQAAAIEWLVTRTKRFSVANLPVGVGKSLLAWAYPTLLGARGAILTETLGLMDQYGKEFHAAGLYDIRGMGNYPCRALANLEKCDAGPCLDGEACPWREAGCSYFDRESEARRRQLVLSNYAYWFTHPDAAWLGPRDVLICDEAHALDAAVSKAAGATFLRSEIELPQHTEVGQWVEWARTKHREYRALLEDKTRDLTYRQRRDVRGLLGRLARLAGASDDTWAFESQGGRSPGMRFESIHAGAYAERVLFRGVSRVVLLSGTVRPDTIEALGVDSTGYDFFESDSPFPAARRPIYWLETGVRVTGETSQTNLEFWAGKIDQVIAARLRWKGILHTVSYERARFLKKHSRFSRHFYIHDSETARDQIEAFRRANAPAILVSPTVHTGWNFPYDEARWQVIGKVPFPDTRYGIAAARKAAIPHYIQKQAAMTLNQMYGRIVRAEDDMGETIIVDDSMKWLMTHYRPLFTKMFREAFRGVNVVPSPIML